MIFDPYMDGRALGASLLKLAAARKLASAATQEVAKGVGKKIITGFEHAGAAGRGFVDAFGGSEGAKNIGSHVGKGALGVTGLLAANKGRKVVRNWSDRHNFGQPSYPQQY